MEEGKEKEKEKAGNGVGLRIKGWWRAACARRVEERGIGRRATPSIVTPSPISHERASFGIRGDVETRTDSQSLAVRSTTWLESAVSAIQISDQDQEDDEDDHGDNDATPRRSILASVVRRLSLQGPPIKDDASIAIADRARGIHRYLSGILFRRDPF